MSIAPTPWSVDLSSIHFAWKQSITVTDANGCHIAHMTRGYEDKEGEPSYANAHLIAAAPDLYEALKWFIDDIDSTHTKMVDFDTNVERARAALAKALGRVP